MLSPSYKDQLRKLDLPTNVDLRIVKSMLNKEWKSCPYPTEHLTRQIGLVGSILAYPLEYGYDQDKETRKAKENAWQMLQKLQICKMSEIEPYNSAFARLYWIYGDGANIELKRLYFTKLPNPWNEAMTKSYDETVGPDTLGRRMSFVREKLEAYCLEYRLKKAARANIAALCRQVDLPNLSFGCPSQIKTLRRRKKKKRSKDEWILLSEADD